MKKIRSTRNRGSVAWPRTPLHICMEALKVCRLCCWTGRSWSRAFNGASSSQRVESAHEEKKKKNTGGCFGLYVEGVRPVEHDSQARRWHNHTLAFMSVKGTNSRALIGTVHISLVLFTEFLKEKKLNKTIAIELFFILELDVSLFLKCQTDLGRHSLSFH